MEWLWGIDLSLQRTINGWHSPALDVPFRLLTYLGLEQVFIPPLLLLMVWPSLRRVAWAALLAWAIAGLGSILTKRLTPRLRPSNLVETWVSPDEQIFHNSFPSGHSTVAFAVAFALLLAWPSDRRPLIGGLALALACGVGLSRIYRGVHWPTDVVAGMCLGLLAALAAVRFLPREVSSEQ